MKFSLKNVLLLISLLFMLTCIPGCGSSTVPSSSPSPENEAGSSEPAAIIPLPEQIKLYKEIQAGFDSFDYDSVSFEDGDAYSDKVVSDAAEHFGLSADDAFYIYNQVATGAAYHFDPSCLKTYSGHVLDYAIRGTNITITVKTGSNLSKSSIIKQNYFDAHRLVKSIRDYPFSTLTYLAVADMTDGTESKIIQFTVPEETIAGVLDGSILETQLCDNITALYLHPSLI